MRVLVAGGAGFLGSHLCDALIARGDSVVCVDNFVTGRRQNIDHLVGRSDFTLIDHDVVQPLDVEAVGTADIDAVMNLASPASPADFASIPLEILDVGSRGTRELLELALGHGARYFQASTSEVYGDPLVHPQPETYWGHV
ncbi:MAG: NAD-dependent epimerase/dehydratase family protein, partial [Ilumatobacteraceae bacterium]